MTPDEFKALRAKLHGERKGPKKPRENPERSLQITTMSYLAYALPDVLAFHVENEGKTSLAAGALAKKMGKMPGVADILLFWFPHHAAIELKAPDGKLSPAQVIWRDRWIATGGLYALCRTLPEVEAAVKSWGLKPKYQTPLANTQSGKQMRQYAMVDAFRPI